MTAVTSRFSAPGGLRPSGPAPGVTEVAPASDGPSDDGRSPAGPGPGVERDASQVLQWPSMPWCVSCNKFLTPSTVRPDATCPKCGNVVERGLIPGLTTRPAD